MDNALGRAYVGGSAESKQIIFRQYDADQTNYIQLYATDSKLELGRQYNGKWEYIWTK